MVREHIEVIPFPNGGKYIRTVQNGMIIQWFQRFEMKVFLAKMGEIEKIKIVVVPAFGAEIQVFDVHDILQVFEELVGHFPVVHQAGSRPDISLIEAFLDFFNQVS